MIDLGQEFFDFVLTHRHDDTVALRLKLSGASLPFPLELALTQIEVRRKAARKLAPFFANPGFLVPSLLSAEQATDWRVARHHARGREGQRVLDLTAGLGIDVLSMARAGATVTAVEIEQPKCETLEHNASLLGLPVSVIHGDACEVVKSWPADSFDTLYIDPARRDGAGNRTYAFSDCQPDVCTLMPSLLALAPVVVIKSSPLLDLSAIVNQLPGVSTIEVVSVGGEVKEVLVTVTREHSADDPEIVMSLLDSMGDGRTITLPMSELGASGVDYAADENIAPGAWLCEPDAAVMKCAPWGWLCRRFPGLKKVSSDTHLFLSPSRPEGFPGRTVRISQLPDKRKLKSLAGTKVNVATRNYPGGTDALRKRLRLTDGGADFLYGFRTASGRPKLVLCTG